MIFSTKVRERKVCKCANNERNQCRLNWIKITHRNGVFFVKEEIFHANFLIRFEDEAMMAFSDKGPPPLCGRDVFSWSKK